MEGPLRRAFSFFDKLRVSRQAELPVFVGPLS
jgi:hypothetical protein